MKARARKIGPATSRKAANQFSVKPKVVYETLKLLGDATCEQVIFKLKEMVPQGKTLREDPISGMFSQLMAIGRVTPTGRTRKNTSGAQAIIWRISSREEREYLKAYVGTAKTPWPSPDTLLEVDDVKQVLTDHEDIKVRRMYRKYLKGRLFKTKLKDKGIAWFMAHYDTHGKRRDNEEKPT